TQPRHRRGENTAMIVLHGESREKRSLVRVHSAHCFLHQTCFKQQLIALQDHLFIPATDIGTEGVVHTLTASTSFLALCGSTPLLQRGTNQGVDNLRSACAPIFPRKIAIPVLPAYGVDFRTRQLPGQAQVTDRNNMLSLPVCPVAVSECVELFDVTQGMMGWCFYPGAQPSLQGAVSGLERTRR